VLVDAAATMLVLLIMMKMMLLIFMFRASFSMTSSPFCSLLMMSVGTGVLKRCNLKRYRRSWSKLLDARCGVHLCFPV